MTVTVLGMTRLSAFSSILSGTIFCVLFPNILSLRSLHCPTHANVLNAAGFAENIGGKLVTVLLPSLDEPSFFKTKPHLKDVSWLEVMQQLNEKLAWESKNKENFDHPTHLELNIVDVGQADEQTTKSDVILLIGLTTESQKKTAACFLDSAKAVAAFDCSQIFDDLEVYGEYNPRDTLEPIFQIFDDFSKNRRRLERNAYTIAQTMWKRKSCDDLLFMLLVLIDVFTPIKIKSVKSVTTTESTSLNQVACMVSNCRNVMIDCLTNEKCRKALDCLNGCIGNDQVRCMLIIVIYLSSTRLFNQLI